MVPSICKLFTSNDRSIRRSLLENIDVFGDKFDTNTIEEKVHIADAVKPPNVHHSTTATRPTAPWAPLHGQKTCMKMPSEF